MKAICRLYVNHTLAGVSEIALSDVHLNYLTHTLRCKPGDLVRLFNGLDGEWIASISEISKKSVKLSIGKLIKAQKNSPDIELLFAPIKNEKLDFLVMRATELGISSVRPIITERTIVTRVNMERMEKNLIEAAEQCERLDVPKLLSSAPLPNVLATFPKNRVLLHCDESGNGKTVREILPNLQKQAVSLLIGPEGGFTDAERRTISRIAAVGISLGPRILRAETATIAALANIQAWLGDWDEKPRFEQ